jgi:hypothetical protein
MQSRGEAHLGFWEQLFEEKQEWGEGLEEKKE